MLYSEEHHSRLLTKLFDGLQSIWLISHDELVDITVKYLLLNGLTGRDADRQYYWDILYKNKPDSKGTILDQQFCIEAFDKVRKIRNSELWKALE